MDCFISYSTKDSKFARFVHSELTRHGLRVYLAELEVLPGDEWSRDILKNPDAARWVVLLASKAAMKAPYVQQEFGIALGQRKNVVPVVWDISPAKLPGWARDLQALDLRGATLEKIRKDMLALAGRMRQDATSLLLVAGVLALAAVALALIVSAATDDGEPRKGTGSAA